MKKIVMFVWFFMRLIYAEDFEVQWSMVYDAKTELLWQKKTSSKKMKWQEAKEYCESLLLQLPNLYEIKSLVNYVDILSYVESSASTLRTNLIDIKIDNDYWSSSEYKEESISYRWAVNFQFGTSFGGHTTSTYYVLCVSGE